MLGRTVKVTSGCIAKCNSISNNLQVFKNKHLENQCAQINNR